MKFREFGMVDGQASNEDDAHLQQIVGTQFAAKTVDEDDEESEVKVKTFEGMDPEHAKLMIRALPWARLQAIMAQYGPLMGARMFRVGARVLRFVQEEKGYTYVRHVKTLNKMGKDGEPMIYEIMNVLGLSMPKPMARQVQCPDGSEPKWSFTSAPPINMRDR